jgi:menaquinone-9 beta-reductase
LLWGFAVRTYIDEPVEEPHILLWTPVRGAAFPGYGWVFPAGDGRANVGLGIGLLADRSAARRATRDLDAFLEHARRVGVLGDRAPARPPARALGAWLKMGLVGTTPARGRVLLVGDAAGLVNPLQGEGIAQAMDSGRAAAEALLSHGDRAADSYRAHLARAHGDYLSTASSAHRSLLGRPKLVAPFTRSLTTPAVGRPLAGAWSITWNDLLDGAPRSRATAAAAAVAGLGRVLTARSADRRWIREHVDEA